MKKWIICIIGYSLILSGCGLSTNPKTNETESNQQVVNQVAGDDSRQYLEYNVTSSSFSKNRGQIINRIYNRQDMDEIERGLMEISNEYFPSRNYSYEEGQYLEDIPTWLARKSKDNEEGLNPSIDTNDSMGWQEKIDLQLKSPNYLAYIHEQNYVNKDGKLAGISVTLAMNTIDYIRVADAQGLQHFDEAKIDESRLIKEGKTMADTIIKRIRKIEGLKDVPIVLSLYKLLDRNSVIPGNHINYAFVDKNESSVKQWEDLNERYYLFPSSTAEKLDRDIHKRLLDLEDYVNQYFTHQDIEFVGTGLYKGEDIQKLVINITSQLIKEPEVVGFTQVLTPEIMDYFPHTPVYIYVRSPEGIKATIVKEVDEEPFVHIH